MFEAVMIPAIGRPKKIQLPDGIRQQLDALYDIIGCDNIEIVRLPGRQCFVVDDCGAINDSHYNPLASAMYGGYIFGDVVYCALIESPDGDGDILASPAVLPHLNLDE